MSEQLREKDRAVLRAVENGHEDTQKIKEQTGLENHEIRYCFEKLEDFGLLRLEKPPGMVERVVDGQKRVFQSPIKAEMTEQGEQRRNEFGKECSKELEDLSHRELVARVKKLERKFEMFRRQVQREL